MPSPPAAGPQCAFGLHPGSEGPGDGGADDPLHGGGRGTGRPHRRDVKERTGTHRLEDAFIAIIKERQA